ncbi:MAG: ATP-binding cassette domain-containing protein [Verrucomicrobiales bacterium]|jgi:ABC-type sugar transport system ATPase subunit|nr:ATP-binding cassette domain-containing protein [Verrucomicrobiales bacterium]
MIRLENISWIAPGKGRSPILDGLSFEVPSAAYAVLMGRTGSGKTTLLEILCGLRAPGSGTVRIDGREVTDLPPGERGIGYVPQDGALFPTLTVREQIAFGLRMRGVAADEIATRVLEAAEGVGVSALLDRLPTGLSGGERQRVALARALVVKPSVLLLDEPLASVDEETQDGLIDLLQRTQREHRITVLHVTHSRREAEGLGELHLRLEGGRVLARTGLT